jgi:mRNA (guanine-N7-)-methyltransferase
MASAAFEPQPMKAPLNDAAISSLRDLIRDKTLDTKLHEHLKYAVEQLTEVAGALNDVGFSRNHKYEREKAKRQLSSAEDDQQQEEAVAEMDRAHQEFQTKVASLTQKMDTSIRSVIDDQIWLDDLPGMISEAVNKAEDASLTQTRTQSQPTQRRRRREGRSSSQSGGGEGEGEGEGEEVEGEEDDPEARPRTDAPHPADAPHILLAAALQNHGRTWSSKTLTEKYARNNDYRGFYRVLYDARHPDESAPPMPDEGLWFAAEEGRDVVPAGSDGEEEEDIEIEKETVRLRCPITFLPYVDPVTSTKCHHSFEKAAILDMLRGSREYVPFTTEQLIELQNVGRNRGERERREQAMRVPQVKCPECNIPLTETDLQPNPALKRRAQRLVAQAGRNAKDATATSDIDEDSEEEDDDDDDDVVRGTQRRPVGLGSSPVPPGAKKRKSLARPVKAERLASVVPQTQLSARGPSSRSRSAILDVEDEELAG